MFGINPSRTTKRIKEITKNILYTRELQNLDCNIYILKNQISYDEDNTNDYELALVDAGNGLNTPNLLEGLKRAELNPLKITKIFITHEHLDHILGIYNIKGHCNPNLEIYALGETARVIREGDEDAIAPRALGISVSMFNSAVKPLNVTEVKDGDVIEFGDFQLNIIYTPGHSLGSMTLYDANKKIIFPGDVVFCGGSFGRVDFPGGSETKLKESISKLSKLDVKYICPGHMTISNEGNLEIQKALNMLKMYF